MIEVSKERLEKIQKAIDVERKYLYINITGVKTTFANFMKSEVKFFAKQNKFNKKWALLEECFDRYKVESLPARKKIISRFISVLKEELTPQEVKEKQIKVNDITADITELKGVGSKLAYLFHKLNIYTIEDLLTFYPKKYIDYSNKKNISQLKEGESVTISGKISSLKSFITKNKLGIVNVGISDGTGTIQLNFFYANSTKFMVERYKSTFQKGSGIIVSGFVKIDNYSGKYTIDKPEYQLTDVELNENTNLNLGRIVPVYSMIEGLSPKFLRRAIYNAINLYSEKIPQIIPEKIKKKAEIQEKKVAIEKIHFPKEMSEMLLARESLVFEEFFIMQLRLAYIREQNKKQVKCLPIKIKENGLVDRFIKSLPFELTGGQKNAVDEILHDLNSEEPMQRLLQGDVGCGKTVVATIMLLAAIENGYQGAIMAPTEILAQQHYNTLVNLLTPLGLSIGLFLGSNSQKMRNIMEGNLESGQTHIAVGTHALIQENIKFKKLGAVVIDEQHRFGVKQRSELKQKGKSPQILTMTATPIPRTLALSVHGDLDLTVIDELPKGRLPIITELYSQGGRKKAFNLIKKEIKNGHQAYIVYPLIEESETLSAKAATEEAEKLRENDFKDYKIGVLHGKLKPKEKEEIMSDFKNKKYDILVCTTVVEVGVDVPNATVMVIENAERFGLSQLHQLRGRVGRSSLQSYCILIAGTSSKETLNKLNVLTQTNNGFVVAEKDLEIRGPGEYLGTKQAGLPELQIADISKDTKLLDKARELAIEFVKTDDITKYPVLFKKIDQSKVFEY